ncbi:MAG: ATP-binding protein [Candidatus Dormibacteraceae bacterium]
MHARRRSWPLRADFAAIALLVALVAVAAGGFVHVRAEADAKQTALADANFAASKAAKQIDLGFATILAISAPTASSPAVAQIFADPAKCSLSYAPIAVFDTGHVDIVRQDGSVVCSSLKPARATTYVGASWLDASGPVVLAPVADAGGDQVAVDVFPIPGYGFLVWFLDLKPLGPKLLAEYGSGIHQLEFLIASSDGAAIVARSVDPTKWTGATLRGTSFAQTAGTADSNDLSGTPRWYGQAIAVTPGWKVYVGADKAGALADAARLQNQQFGIVAAGLAVVLVGLLLGYRRVAQPMERLRASVRSSRGLESPKLVPTGGPSEVADLGEDINGLITSLKHEWAEREGAQQNYMRLFEGSPLPTLLVDPDTGKFLEANDAAADAFGHSRKELTELTIADLYGPMDAEDEAEVAAARSRKSSVRLGPITLRKKDGSLLRVLVTTYGVLYGGRPARISMVEDVTQKERLERQLNQSQRLESLGQLAGGVAHDFNNLLGVILNFAAFAKEKVLDESKGVPNASLQLAAKDIDRVVRAGESAARLTHQLLAFARREVVRPQSIDVNAVVAELEPLVGRGLGEHIEFVTSPGKNLWPASMDPGQLEQVLTNLAVNARDAMPHGGKLIIDCENVDVDAAYAVGKPGLEPGRFVRIRVTDTGTGMDATTLRRVFEPFFTTKPKGQGTGLGLATVYGIVTQAGGDISIYSEVGIGTRVHVLLPASDRVPHRVATNMTGLRPLVSAVRILVVEDADDLREITELILKKAGYQVITANCGTQALEMLVDLHGEVDLLLTDVVMPRMQGPELVERIQAEYPEIRVLYMSGYAQTILGDGGTLADGVLLLEKPFTEAVLLGKVEQALRRGILVAS